MKQLAVLVTATAAGLVPACSVDYSAYAVPEAGAGASAGGSGAGGGDNAGAGGGDNAGAGGGDNAGAGGGAATGGAAGAAGRTSNTGGSGGTQVQPTPALPADAPTVTCPTVINGSLEVTDRSQTGRHSRVTPVSACGTLKAFPGNAADTSNPHLFEVHRFVNPTSSPACFTFTLSEASAVVGGDAGLDAGPDAATVDAGVESGSGSGEAPVVPSPPRYMTAYGTFFPTNLALEFLGDVGDVLAPPQTMGVRIPAGETIDVVVYAVDNAPAGVGGYTLSCSTQ